MCILIVITGVFKRDKERQKGGEIKNRGCRQSPESVGPVPFEGSNLAVDSRTEIPIAAGLTAAAVILVMVIKLCYILFAIR